MYTAKEAREHALNIEHKKYQEQIENITIAINNAVERGDFAITLSYAISDVAINDLRRLDYLIDLRFDPQDKTYYTVISW